MIVAGNCTVTCATHNTFFGCTDDANCQWDDKANACQRQCSSISDFTTCGTQLQCNWIPSLALCLQKCSLNAPDTCALYQQCELVNDTTCTETCPYRYGTRDNCNADPECEWYSKTASCGPRRCVETSDAACTEGGCLWNATTGSCERPPCQWSDSISCDNDPACTWYLGNQTCIALPCPFTTPSSCATRAGWCKWSGGECVYQCSLWGTQLECLGAACAWTLQGTCANPCAVAYGSSATLCSTDPNCMMNISSNNCTASCATYGSAANCPKQLCIWSGSFCMATCSVVYSGTNAAYCSTNPSCEVAADGSCMQKCSVMNATACSGLFCAVRNGTCKTTCAGKYSTSTTCMQNRDCVWDGNTCQASCTTLSPGICPASYCTRVNGGSTCLNQCGLEYFSESSCNADSNCMWYNGGCLLACALNTVAQCAAPCIVSQGTSKCTAPCSLRYATAATCSTDPTCQWNYISGTCGIKTCAETSQTGCEADPLGCVWLNNMCYNPCSSTPLQAPCTAVPGAGAICTWDQATVSCVLQCAYRTVDDCVSNVCDFVNNVCQASCASQTSITPCLDLNVCEWTAAGTCKLQCQYAYDTQAACDADPSCTWDSATNVCRTAICTSTSEVTCLSDSQCFWNATSSTCEVTNCGFSDPESCDASGFCVWMLGVPSGSCQPDPCPSYPVEAMCVASPKGCLWNETNATCYYNPCHATSADVCNTDTSCTWNATSSTCDLMPQDCEYSSWSTPTQCTQVCNGGTNTSYRSIVRQATNGGTPCDANDLVLTQACNTQACNCSAIDNAVDCTRADCSWNSGTCEWPATGCAAFTEPDTCLADPNCVWVGVCINAQGVTAGAAADLLGCGAGQFAPVATIPGSVNYTRGTVYQVFPSVNIDVDLGTIEGVTVSIESGQSRGMDTMWLNQSFNLSSVFLPNRGVLVISGPAPAAVFGQALQQVMFFTFSFSPAPRIITWNTGIRHVVSSKTRHIYHYNITGGAVSWLDAKAICASTTLFGLPGYLASILSSDENRVLSHKLAAQAWIGASDFQQTGMWRWLGGPEATMNGTGLLFWDGPNSAYGGNNVSGGFSAWEPTGVTFVQGEPNGLQSTDFSWFKLNGYWAARANNDVEVDAFICEFGDAEHAIPNNVWGVVVLQPSGCMPVDPIATTCASRGTKNDCLLSTECTWTNATTPPSCMMGCAWLSDPLDCASTVGCHLNLDSIPSVCTVDICTGSATCDNPLCASIGGKCQYNTQCSRFTTQAGCESSPESTCAWDAATSTCTKVAMCASYMSQGACLTDVCQANCLSDPSCDYFANFTTSLCVAKHCDSLATTCDTKHCRSVNLALPTTFRPGAPPTQVFASAPAVPSSFGFTVAITSGFVLGDQLIFSTVQNPAFRATFSRSVGLLTVIGASSAAAFQRALTSITFVTANNDGKNRTFSWALLSGPSSSLGPVYFPQFNIFAEYVAADQISYGAAATRCQGRTLFNLTGGLLTIASMDQQQAFASTLAPPVNAWIGAKAIPTSTGAVWMWDTNTAVNAGVVFYRGDVSLGQPVGYQNFAAGEPAAVTLTTSRYVYMQPDGTWATAVPTTTVAGGFLCSFAAAPGPNTYSGSVTLTAVGCFLLPCSYSDQAACQLDSMCTYDLVDQECTVSPCYQHSSLSSCSAIGGCYFSALTGTCVQNVNDACTQYTDSASCARASSDCAFMGGRCGTVGCLKYPDSPSCSADPSCMYSDGTCVSRLCGYISQTPCISDAKCQWTAVGCSPLQCIGATNQSSCLSDTSCTWAAAMVPPCSVNPCQYTDKFLCFRDANCLWDSTTSDSGNCTRNTCPVLSSTDCGNNVLCSWDSVNSICAKKLCYATTEAECLSITDTLSAQSTATVSICTWTNVSVPGTDTFNAYCSVNNTDAQLALAAAQNSPGCTPTIQEWNSTPLVIALGVSVGALVLVLVGMIHRQRVVRERSGMDFSRRNYDDTDDEGESQANEMNEEEAYEPPQNIQGESRLPRPDISAL